MGKLLSFQDAQDLLSRTQSDNEVLQKALAARDKFLEEHPDMQSYQDEIDKRLKGAGSSENRMVILSMMMKEKLSELHVQCTEFVEKARKLESLLKGISEQQKLQLLKK